MTKMDDNWLDVYLFVFPENKTTLRQPLKPRNFILIFSVCAKTSLWGLVKYKMAVWHPHAFIFNCTLIAILCHLGKTRRVENLFNSQISSSRFLRVPIGFHGNICWTKPTQIKGRGKVIVFCFSTFNLSCTCLSFFLPDEKTHLST